MAKLTGNNILDTAIAKVNKQFKKGELVTMGPSREPIRTFPSGSFALDRALGCGGIPTGRLIEWFGPEASFKTSMALSVIKSYQKYAKDNDTGKKTLFVDMEHSTTIELVRSMGIDVDDMLWSRPETAEEALSIVLDLTNTGQVGLIIFDSIDAAQSEQQLKREVGETHMGGIAKILNETLRRLSKMAAITDTTVIFLNQMKANIGVMYGPSYTTPGGSALKYYCGVRIQNLSPKDSPIQGAGIVRPKIVKNKFAPPRKLPIEIQFYYAKGIDIVSDTINAAKAMNALKQQGIASKIFNTETEEYETLTSGGTAGLYEFLQEPAELKKLQDLCIQMEG